MRIKKLLVLLEEEDRSRGIGENRIQRVERIRCFTRRVRCFFLMAVKRRIVSSSSYPPSLVKMNFFGKISSCHYIQRLIKGISLVYFIPPSILCFFLKKWKGRSSEISDQPENGNLWILPQNFFYSAVELCSPVNLVHPLDYS